MFKVKRELWVIVIVLAALAALFAPSASAAGQRLVAHVEEPFEVNGQLFPAGELTLRQIGSYSPVSTLTEVCVDGQCLGMMLARESAVYGESTRDELIFNRDEDGHLVLEAVAFLGQPTRQLFGFREGADGNRWSPPVAQATERPLWVASTKKF